MAREKEEAEAELARARAREEEAARLKAEQKEEEARLAAAAAAAAQGAQSLLSRLSCHFASRFTNGIVLLLFSLVFASFFSSSSRLDKNIFLIC